MISQIWHQKHKKQSKEQTNGTSNFKTSMCHMTCPTAESLSAKSEKVSISCMSDKRLITRTQKELLWLSHKKQTMLQGTKNLNRHFSKERYKWPANKKKCPTALIPWEVQIKTTRREHLTLTRMATRQNKKKKSCGGRWAAGTLHMAGRNRRQVQPLKKMVWWFLKT